MFTTLISPLDVMIRKLGPARLSHAEQDAIRSLPVVVRTVEARQDIVHEGGPTAHCCILLEGLASSYHLLDEGKRQLLSLYVPGDLPDLPSLQLPDPDYGITALTASRVAFVPHAELHRLIGDYPAIAQVLWRDTLISAAIHRAWIVGLGRRTARSRLAHLFCELYLRLKVVGLTDGKTVPMLMTQSDLADALGLSSVHVNRSLQELRQSGLIELHGRRLIISDWSGLCAEGEFNSRYLHLPAC